MRKRRLAIACALAGLWIVAVAGSAAALTDGELFDTGRTAYQQGEYVKAAMWLFAYVQRDPVMMKTDADHRAQVENVLEFCQEEPGRMVSELNGSLKACESARMELADRCGEQVVASTKSYMIQRPRLEPLSEAAQRNPRTYPLSCRGAAGLELSWQPVAKDLGEKDVLVLEFRRGRQGVKGRPDLLGPGECSWQDRGVSGDEPYRLCYPVEPETFSVTWALPSEQVNQLGPGVPASLRDLGSAETVSQFQVYNNRAGCLVAVPPVLMKVLPLRIPATIPRPVPSPRDLRLR